MAGRAVPEAVLGQADAGIENADAAGGASVAGVDDDFVLMRDGLTLQTRMRLK